MNNSALRYGEYYHVFNRGNNGEKLFLEDENYRFFLELYTKYIFPVADTLAYCLMPNHFHFVIRIREEQDIKSFNELKLFEEKMNGRITDKRPIPSNQFSHLFISYTKSMNKKRKRTGSLFEHPFERIIIEDEIYLQNVIAYVHNNPLKAELVKSVSGYKWSSYKTLITEEKQTKLDRDFVLKLFGGKQNFINFNEGYKEEMVIQIVF